MSADPDLDMVTEHCTKLGEHFDTVQIFVTRHEAGKEDGTVNVNYGSGNWFARYGQVKEWVLRRDEDTRVSIRENRGEG
jgi:hypothetical protein